MRRARGDDTKVRSLPRNVQKETFTAINKSSFKKLAGELKKGKRELYMAAMVNTKNRADKKHFESAEEVKTAEHFKKLIYEYGDVFRQEFPDEPPAKRSFKF